MEQTFWHTRWAKGEIGFHEGRVNPYLKAYWHLFANYRQEPVFVPLCGKAYDLWWLGNEGHPVLGVELSERACRDFFAGQCIEPRVETGQPFTRFCHGDLALWCGDFFELTPADLTNVRLAYDRAALIALPPEMRPAYVQHFTQTLPNQARVLLITLDYEQDRIKGPPFNVSDVEVEQLYGGAFTIERLHSDSLGKDHPFAQRRGLEGATETVFQLQKRIPEPDC